MKFSVILNFHCHKTNYYSRIELSKNNIEIKNRTGLESLLKAKLHFDQ